jgi:hypothetical protein
MSTEKTNPDEEYLDKMENSIEFCIYTALALSMMGFFGVFIYFICGVV